MADGTRPEQDAGDRAELPFMEEGDGYMDLIWRRMSGACRPTPKRNSDGVAPAADTASACPPGDGTRRALAALEVMGHCAVDQETESASPTP